MASAAFAEARASVAVADAKREQAAINFEWTKVSAPITGTASRRMVDPGNLVQADTSILTTIVSTEKMYINFDIDERTLLRLRRLVSDGKLATRDKQTLVVSAALVDEEKGTFPHRGVIDFTDNTVDPGTGTLRLRGVFENPVIGGDPASRSVRRIMSPGLFARVRMPIGPPHNAILIPEKAIGSDQGQKYVFLVNAENEVVRSEIVVGSLHGSNREILKGVSPTDRVIVSGMQRVRLKMKVKPTAASDFARDAKTRRESAPSPKATLGGRP